MADLFDPSAYAPKLCERDFNVTDAEWIERFVAHMIKEGSPVADDEFRLDLPSYARKVAPDYLKTRREYTDPEEAADTDISYWENEE